MISKEQILLDMLSGEASRVLHASHEVKDSAITNTKLIKELYPYLPEIKKKSSNLQYGGAILPNKRFVEKAIQMIEASVDEKCLCEYLFDDFGQNGKNMERFGFVLLEETMDNYINKSIIECPVCFQRYEVVEEDTGWHINSTRYRKI